MKMQLIQERQPYGPRARTQRRNRMIVKMFENGMTRHQIVEELGLSYCIVKDALHGKYPGVRSAKSVPKVTKQPTTKRAGWLRRFPRWIW